MKINGGPAFISHDYIPASGAKARNADSPHGTTTSIARMSRLSKLSVSAILRIGRQ
jgi:hypothetical protein